MSTRDHDHDLSPLRAQLSAKSGREYWRSLEELAETEAFQDFLHREFPPSASEWNDPVGRRSFLKLMSASMAFAGLTACTVQPKEVIVPYVQTPENLTPGKAQYYATSMTLGGVAEGLLVETHEGRPTKIEGNPDHPASLGAASVLAQASILSLYDPDRSQTVTYLGETRAWGDFLGEVRSALDAQRGKQGAGLRVLTETVTSPTAGAQLKALLTDFPRAQWHQFEPAGQDSARVGAELAFGQMVNTVHHIEAAEIIVALDSDFLTKGPGALRYAREFAKKRRVSAGHSEMSRFYAVESSLTATGAKADHRLAVRASDVQAIAAALAAKVGVASITAPALDAARDKWVTALANDLQKQRGKSVVIAGEAQSPGVHALAHAINQALGNVGTTVSYTESIEASPVDQVASIKQLASDMNSERVELLFIIGGNPVYNAPADVKFLDGLRKVPLRVHLGLYNDETGEQCHWHIPEAHYLEAWGDARAYDGTASIIQPMIYPLYNGKSSTEVLAVLLNKLGVSSLDLLKEYWKTKITTDFDKAWRQALHDGVIGNTAATATTPTPKADFATSLKLEAQSGIEVVFRADPNIFDGRFVNNGWLEELPKPITKLTWENAALMSPETAVKRLNIASEDKPFEANGKVLEVEAGGRKIAVPVWVVPGHANDSITLSLGYGRTRAGKVGTGIGYDAYQIRTSDAPLFTTNVKIQVTGRHEELASTQEHFALEGLGERQIVRTGSLEDYKKDPESLFHGEKHAPGKDLTLYTPFEYKGYLWGMAIDMNSCVGCNACVIACQAENNIPVVGKEMVKKNREMHWLRIDTYFRGSVDNPETYFQPMLCQHCDQAPCEVVCPVNATVHDAEGLNVQVYNRCVGTRYCSNNCPYKVRRFNFLLYNDYATPSLKLMRNPEVTVRSRGVMEKCTFCVQRIMHAKIESEKEDRKIRDGEIVTACQQTCPAEAIRFGNLNDPESAVSKLSNEPRSYGVLAELNVRPRVSYLADIRNPNGELGSTVKREESHNG
jgi:MoCo/4Fe-4S cofactor protein with predicted Tat translocation signal